MIFVPVVVSVGTWYLTCSGLNRKPIPDWYKLLKAADSGCIDDVKEVIAAGNDVDMATPWGFNTAWGHAATPLRVAAKNGHHEIVLVLIAAGATVDLADDNGCTPLWMAASNGHLEIVATLIAHNATVDLANNEGFTPLCIAAARGHVEIVRLLIHANADTTLGNERGPPVDQVCTLPSADEANEGEIKAILLSAHLNIPETL